MALVAGVQAPLGRVMGHAGACITPFESDAKTKIQALRDAGVVLTNHPAKFGETMKSLLNLRSTVPFSVCMPHILRFHSLILIPRKSLVYHSEGLCTRSLRDPKLSNVFILHEVTRGMSISS